MTNQGMFLKRLTLLNIPLSLEGKELPSELKAKIMLMRVAYDKAAKAFDDDMQQVLKEIKKEGYDERAQKINRMKEIDGKEDATKEEKKEADEIRKTEEDFNKETEELNKAYSEAYQEKMKEECDMKPRKFAFEGFAKIIELIGTDGAIKVKWDFPEALEIPKEEFISLIATNLVDNLE